ncbi:hypothetical protein RHGRI_003879 [Rhododendron griersonianum]|uniref:Helicase ATP-binding domain-containing protein n=1 Tax=Rhododendron griersonianum TaxID=479676 RepID=A0AAV6L6K0_9ERIC|nr:hypothetical protein RHGRI_003879 [Rhododendron griersonianum]
MQILMNEIPKKYPHSVGCVGGGCVQPTFAGTSFAYIMNFGVCSYAIVPYQGQRTTTKMPYNATVVKIGAYEMIKNVKAKQQDILKVIRTQPITGTMVCPKSMLSYTSGVYWGDQPDSTVDKSKENFHAVVIVGYGMFNGTLFYIIRNTWGKEWGQGGYAMVAWHLFLAPAKCVRTGKHEKSILYLQNVPESSGASYDVSNNDVPSGDMVDLEDESALNTIVTRSGQVCTINLLEDIIEDARNKDLSQPKTEASPPDGLLAVPLQSTRIDGIIYGSLLSESTCCKADGVVQNRPSVVTYELEPGLLICWWRKETASLPCSGGILADDQGLGKTISTIALILKERAPSSRAGPDHLKHSEMETLNLDEDDDFVSGVDGPRQDVESFQVLGNGLSQKKRDTSVQTKGRPAAGALVVCPTSVLRQWAEELLNKVTKKANLSVLVYHGGNRTKDPCELAKYDMVLTTYSIVSMEVPKQPLVDKDDAEIGRQEVHVVSSCRKRKYPPTSGKRSAKDKKGMDNGMFESSARPLARVGWFRAVLDEAQSIKNHKTQVAWACWGLRAKRRWCLSGTPIQNAVDDLLVHVPQGIVHTFPDAISFEVKPGTLLDGEPIINLLLKSIELKNVEFTDEERDFYCRLEADSWAQFAEYVAEGTVKQNYFNILLMLLRLRQACDHPLLIQEYNSSSAWRSTVEKAKKLPREKQVCLLNCLETSLAICGICNEPTKVDPGKRSFLEANIISNENELVANVMVAEEDLRSTVGETEGESLRAMRSKDVAQQPKNVEVADSSTTESDEGKSDKQTEPEAMVGFSQPAAKKDNLNATKDTEEIRNLADHEDVQGRSKSDLSNGGLDQSECSKGETKEVIRHDI